MNHILDIAPKWSMQHEGTPLVLLKMCLLESSQKNYKIQREQKTTN